MKHQALARGAASLLASACALVVWPSVESPILPPSASTALPPPGAASTSVWPSMVEVARADPALPPSCVLRGSGPVPKGSELYDQPAGGRVIARFTGALVPLSLSSFPGDPTQGRTRVSTSAGASSMRIDGWTSATPFLVYASRDLPVVPGHVWIASAQRVRLVQSTATTLTGEVVASGTTQAARAAATCDGFTLQRGTPRAQEVPGNGRLYASKGGPLELFDQPGGAPIFTLRTTEGTSQLYWSTEARAGFVHLVGRGDLAIDAWAKESVLEPMKRGEMVDQAAPMQTTVAGAQLVLDGGRPPTIIVATKDLPLRAHRDDKEAPIGALEIGGEAYLMETMTGWANLLPKHLGFTPGDGSGFYVQAAELPRR